MSPRKSEKSFAEKDVIELQAEFCDSLTSLVNNSPANAIVSRLDLSGIENSIGNSSEAPSTAISQPPLFVEKAAADSVPVGCTSRFCVQSDRCAILCSSVRISDVKNKGYNSDNEASGSSADIRKQRGMGDRFHSMDLVTRKSESNLFDAVLFHSRKSETLIHSRRNEWSEKENSSIDKIRRYNDTFSRPTSPAVPKVQITAENDFQDDSLLETDTNDDKMDDNLHTIRGPNER